MNVIGYVRVSSLDQNEDRQILAIPALSELDVLRLPTGLREIEAEAFAGLACEAVIVPDGCKSIAAGAFADCQNLLYIYIPQGVTVDEKAFERSDLVIVDQEE